VLTYSFTATYVNPGTAVTVAIGGLTNSSTAGSYPAELTTNGTNNQGPSLPIDTGLAGPLTLTAGALVSPSWSISKGATGASGAAYTYGFNTSTNGTLSSVTMTVPPGTAGTPAIASTAGVPSNGTAALSGTVLSYSFTAAHVSLGSAISISISGITNTSTTGTYVTQLTTNGSSASAPIDNGLAGPLSFSAGTMGSPTWATSTTAVGVAGVTYSISLTTASGATFTSVSMSLPVGTVGTPAGGSVSGVPTGGTWSLAGTTLTYSFASIYLNPGTAVRLSVGGMTNTTKPGSYVAELTSNGSTTNGASYPIDTGVTGAVTFR